MMKLDLRQPKSNNIVENKYHIMPEGPEVETIRRGLLPVMNRKIVQVKVADHEKYQPIKEKIIALKGSKITDIMRRGKFLVWSFEKSSDKNAAINHLGMTGVWYHFSDEIWRSKKSPFDTHKHYKVYFHLDDDSHLLFVNVRTFGRFEVIPHEMVESYPPIAKLGPDVLEKPFNTAEFKKRLRGKGKKYRTKEIGKCLLDYSIIAGCGNIYKSEALFEAGIHPMIPANKLSDKAIERLGEKLSEVANKALKFKGSTIRDYQYVNGYNGLMQNEFRVYGREGESCLRRSCNGMIVSGRQGDRTSYWCEKCQTL